VFNQHINAEGVRRMYIYTLGVASANNLRVPLKITLKDEKITVEFSDKTRHIFHYNSDVEIFDRVLQPKEKKL
jgi:hypothetical protein